MVFQAAASKPAGDHTTQSGKQEGLSNTDTKHSTNITDDPEKSTKGEGRDIYRSCGFIFKCFLTDVLIV